MDRELVVGLVRAVPAVLWVGLAAFIVVKSGSRPSTKCCRA